jgi:hypothetical protein
MGMHIQVAEDLRLLCCHRGSVQRTHSLNRNTAAVTGAKTNQNGEGRGAPKIYKKEARC